MRILIVEDDRRLAATLVDLMDSHHYLSDVSYDGESGLDNALSGIYDLMILDIMLPGLDGLQVVSRLRSEGNHTPVLILTARTQTGDKVTGLDAGADYYLTKPFDSEELMACVRALTRRQGNHIPLDRSGFGDLTFELTSCVLRCGDRSVRLSRKEFEIMRLLMANHETVTAKETLLLKVWGYESDAEDNNVEAYISFLRKKLTHLKSQVIIRTLRLIGYQLEVVS